MNRDQHFIYLDERRANMDIQFAQVRDMYFESRGIVKKYLLRKT